MARTFMALYLRLFAGLSEQFLTIANNLLNFKKQMSILKWAYRLDKNQDGNRYRCIIETKCQISSEITFCIFIEMESKKKNLTRVTNCTYTSIILEIKIPFPSFFKVKTP